MNRYSRGEFLGIGAALAAGFGIGDFELRGSDGRLARARAKARVQEAGDVTPGFIDAHLHPASGGVRELTEVNLDVRSMADIGERLREGAAGKSPGEWVLAFKYDDTKVREGRRITRRDLDEWVPDHPVRVSHRGGHLYWYNSRAFELAGITAETESPPGGQIQLDDGELNGLLAENANDLFQGLLPSGFTREERQAGVKLISEPTTAAGLTSLHDTGCSTDYAVACQDACKAGELRCRIPHETDPEAFQEIGIVRTVVGGRTMHLA